MLNEKDLKVFEKKFDRLILQTPTSQLRNDLTDVNILIQSHRELYTLQDKCIAEVVKLEKFKNSIRDLIDGLTCFYLKDGGKGEPECRCHICLTKKAFVKLETE